MKIRTPLCALSLAAVTALSACGTSVERVEMDSDRRDTRTVTNTVDLAQLRAAGERTAAVTSGRFSARIEMDVPGDQQITTSVKGIFAGDRRQITVEIASAGAKGGDVAGFGEPSTLVIDGTTLYARGGVYSMMSGRDGWVRVDLGEKAGDALRSMSGMWDSQQAEQYLTLIAGADNVTSKGIEEVNGVTCERLSATVTLRNLVDDDSLPPASRDRVRELFDQMDGQGAASEPMPIDLWSCDDGYVHRMRVGMSFLGMQQNVQFELWDLGADVAGEITVPTDATPLDLQALADALPGQRPR